MGDGETEDEMRSGLCTCGHEMEEHMDSDGVVGSCWFADGNDFFCACPKFHRASGLQEQSR